MEHTRAVTVARAGVHVLFAALVVIGMVRALQHGAPVWGAALASAALILLYFSGKWAVGERPSSVYVWVLALTSGWVLALLWSPEYVWVSFALLLIGGHLLRGRWAAAYGLVVVVCAIAIPWAHRGVLTTPDVVGPVIGGLFATGIARAYTSVLADAAEHRRLVASLLAARRETESLQAELIRTQREAGAMSERTRIARDIHDTIAQEFSSISLLARSAADDAHTEGDAGLWPRIDAMARRGAEDTRRIVRDLLPAELESSQLAESLSRVVDGFAAETGIAARFVADDLGVLPSATEVALLRTLQTALANVRLHASAGRVSVELRVVGETVRCDIVDDGAGFSAAAWEAGRGAGTSFGLREARARLEELGGGLDVESAPGEGCALSAWVSASIDEPARPGARRIDPPAEPAQLGRPE